ncbi:MAG: hypothetical protein DWB56_06965 [Candidatus Jettenia sp.]|uniref:Uncharacterized protein n=1 Tax=Candidatus Jettenia caeni TaxID=247490 RepID=I3IMV7_9BACT|nr:MAG: hypothetical protein EDM77_03905 [Candidatus Jettenia sp. AMX1]MBC6928695.1 hypothetical protein [Candidatus Jettenia sp.]GAB63052.1 hypothetical protein KSU1_C1456 [Candidatus Jettenia caeni]MCE7880007.1 hypothetical protein [Candidatus Jettenia sp. AMX1]MCQ3926789.1 hypothetical protein [Candidatus Jettenia sp.]
MKNNKPPIIPPNPPLKKGEMFDIVDQANFSQEKILPSFSPFLNLSFFPPFFKGGLGGIRGKHEHTVLFSQGDTSLFMEHYS